MFIVTIEFTNTTILVEPLTSYTSPIVVKDTGFTITKPTKIDMTTLFPGKLIDKFVMSLKSSCWLGCSNRIITTSRRILSSTTGWFSSSCVMRSLTFTWTTET